MHILYIYIYKERERLKSDKNNGLFGNRCDFVILQVKHLRSNFNFLRLDCTFCRHIWKWVGCVSVRTSRCSEQPVFCKPAPTLAFRLCCVATVSSCDKLNVPSLSQKSNLLFGLANFIFNVHLPWNVQKFRLYHDSSSPVCVLTTFKILGRLFCPLPVDVSRLAAYSSARTQT